MASSTLTTSTSNPFTITNPYGDALSRDPVRCVRRRRRRGPGVVVPASRLLSKGARTTSCANRTTGDTARLDRRDIVRLCGRASRSDRWLADARHADGPVDGFTFVGIERHQGLAIGGFTGNGIVLNRRKQPGLSNYVGTTSRFPAVR